MNQTDDYLLKNVNTGLSCKTYPHFYIQAYYTTPGRFWTSAELQMRAIFPLLIPRFEGVLLLSLSSTAMIK
jgi:hypothetical protein